MLFIVIGCNANKQIQLTHSDKEVELFFSDYGKGIKQVSISLKRKVVFKNPYFWFAKVKLNYFVDGEQIDDILFLPMQYNEKGEWYIIGDKGEIKISPLGKREAIYEVRNPVYDLKFTGIYKNLEQYISLSKHPIYKNKWTGKMEEDRGAFIYEESFSEFKLKNPELAEFLTKGDTIELEVLSPIKAKYRYDAQW